MAGCGTIWCVMIRYGMVRVAGPSVACYGVAWCGQVWHGSWRAMEWQVEPICRRTRYRMDCRTVLQAARERCKKHTQGKSKTWTRDMCLPLEGTSNAMVTEGPSAEHLCARTQPCALHTLSHESSQQPCMIALEKVRLREVKYFPQGHTANKWWRHMWTQVHLSSFSVFPGGLLSKQGFCRGFQKMLYMHPGKNKGMIPMTANHLYQLTIIFGSRW